MVLLLYDPCRTNFLTSLVTAPADPPPTSNELTDTFNSLVSATEKLITKSRRARDQLKLRHKNALHFWSMMPNIYSK